MPPDVRISQKSEARVESFTKRDGQRRQQRDVKKVAREDARKDPRRRSGWSLGPVIFYDCCGLLIHAITRGRLRRLAHGSPSSARRAARRFGEQKIFALPRFLMLCQSPTRCVLEQVGDRLVVFHQRMIDM